MSAALDALQRLNRHPEELEPPLLQRRVDTRGPLHLTPPAHELDVVLGETVDAVAPAFLRGLAGTVGCREDRGHVLVVRRNRHYADAGAEAEYPVLPGKAEVAHALAQGLGSAHGLIQRATHQQETE